MPCGKYFAGDDYVPCRMSSLSYSTSVRQFRKQKTISSLKCKREVPLKDEYEFCGNFLR